MKARQIDRDEAVVPWFAARDAQTRSAVAATGYTNQQHARAAGIRFALELVYRSTEVYCTYRQRFVAIKVADPTIVDRSLLRELEAAWSAETGFSVDKVRTPQGIIYRIKFK